MKKLGKLIINPEKVIKNEELINLKGGYDTGCESGIMCYGDCFDISGSRGQCQNVIVGGGFVCKCVV
jgi:hypothetical protein